MIEVYENIKHNNSEDDEYHKKLDKIKAFPGIKKMLD